MKKISISLLAVLLCSQLVFAQVWVSHFKSNALSNSDVEVFDLFEMDDGNFLSSGRKPGMVLLNSETGDTLWTSDIAQGQAVRTTDGGFMFYNTKLNSNFEIEWSITESIYGLGGIWEIIQGSGDLVIYSGTSTTLLLGDAYYPFEYNCIWSLNSATGLYPSSVNFLALPVQTFDNWSSGPTNNDIVPLLDGNGWMVFAHCNYCDGCFIKVPYSGSISQSCVDLWEVDTRTIIHANEGDGYIVTDGYRIIAKVDLNGNHVWTKYYQTTVPPVVPGVYGFHSIISTGTDGYIAVGRTYSNPKPNLWIVKIDNNGNLQWQSDYIKIKNYRTVGRTILKTSDGGYLIGGVAVQLASPYYLGHPFFVKMDSTGNCRPQAAFIHSIDNYTLNIVSNTSTGAHEYTWLFGNSDTAQTATPVYTYPYPGTYNLCLVATNPCGNDTLCTQIDVATGIHKPDNPIQSITLYPNPVSANQNIYWQADGISSGASLELRVFNLTGNILYREQPNQPSGILPSHTWPPGLYFLQLITPNSQTTVRLVVSGE
ncbi:MAG: T9SS type A sorting domain-containing protein [Sphingobacteriales bacterium]|nr:MAG: T9SS type A sorting domain-containing protein [Sphingobacteriales bacterium]